MKIRRNWLQWVLGTAAVAAVATGATLGYAVLTASPPAGDLEAARVALEGARTVEASRYAQAEFEIAERNFQHASRAYRLAEARWLGFRAYEEVAGQLEDARRKADAAMEAALRRREEHRARAEEMISEAERMLERAHEGVPRVPFANAMRTSMTSAEVALHEARTLRQRGDFPGATERAAAARAALESVNRRIDTFLTEYTSGRQAERWERWVEEAIEQSRRSRSSLVVVDKMRRLCKLYNNGRLVRTYRADLGSRPMVQKVHSGDKATPEGRYRVTEKRGRGQTKYYKALMLNYPNEEDRARYLHAKRNGWVARGAGPGGLIEIHGDGGRNEDWTLGCVALHNRDMDHLFDRVEVGTPVVIVGALGQG